MEAVAHAIGVSAGAVNGWELDRANPTQEHAAALDAYLHADGAILRAYGFVSPTRPIDAADLVELRQEVIRRFEEIWGRVEYLSARVEDLAALTLPTSQQEQKGDGRSNPEAGKSHKSPSPSPFRRPPGKSGGTQGPGDAAYLDGAEVAN